MHVAAGTLQELRLDPNGQMQASIACPAALIPQPGQYVMALAVADADSSLAQPLFPQAVTQAGFLAAAPLPVTWQPGAKLMLRGPLGHGFHLPPLTRRLALAACGLPLACLLPLLDWAQHNSTEAAIFTDFVLPPLPSFVEISPLSDLPSALLWADFLALEIPLARLADLPHFLDLQPGQLPACSGQVLVRADMPCGALADCGVCALPHGRRWQLVCKDGPVFALEHILA